MSEKRNNIDKMKKMQADMLANPKAKKSVAKPKAEEPKAEEPKETKKKKVVKKED